MVKKGKVIVQGKAQTERRQEHAVRQRQMRGGARQRKQESKVLTMTSVR